MMASYDGTIRINTEIDTSGIQKELEDVKSSVQDVSDQAVELNSNLQGLKDIGQKALDKAIEYGAKFEDSWTMVSTQLDTTKIDVEELEKKILSLSTSTGIAAEDMTKALSRALSSGVLDGANADEIIKYMNQVSELSKVTNTDISTTTDATTDVMNAYKLRLKDVAAVNNVLYQVQQKSGESIDTVGNCMASVSSNAKDLKVGYQEVGAALSTMTKSMSAKEASSGLNALLDELSDNNSKASNSLAEATKKVYGHSKSFQELQAEGKSVSDILQLMKDNLGGTSTSFDRLIDSEAGANAATKITDDYALDFKDSLTILKTETDTVSNAYGDLSNTLNSKFGKAVNGGKNVLIGFYGVLGPAQDALVAYRLKQVLLGDSFKSLPKSTDIAKGAIKKVGEAFKTLGSKLKDVLSKIGEFSKSAVKGMGTAFSSIGGKVKSFGSTSVKGLGNSFKSMGGFFKSFGKTMGAAMISFGPYLLIIGAVAAAAYLIYENWDKIKPVLLAIWNAIKEAALAVWGGIKEFFSTLWDGLTEVFSTVWGVISGVLSTVCRGIKQKLGYPNLTNYT